MKILISGSHGLIGSRLVRELEGDGHQVARLVRSTPQPGSADVQWDIDAGTIDGAALEGFDAVIHLAGENLFGRWTDTKKRKIRESRVKGTSLLSGALAGLTRKPGVLVSASAMGIYGDRGDEELPETAEPGTGFIPEVVASWEAAADPAREAGIRVVHTRFGLVMDPDGGTLGTMLTPFRLGLGGPVGSGRQYFSWVALDDVIGVVRFALDHEELEGPVNVVAPESVTNGEFTRTLGSVLGRPTIFRVPRLPVQLAMGDLAGELFGSIRPVPERLQQAGYAFRWPTLEPALRHMLGKGNE